MQLEPTPRPLRSRVGCRLTIENLRTKTAAAGLCGALLLGGTLLATAAATATATATAAEPIPSVLFQERFEDSRLLERGWYDGSRFAIANQNPAEGQGSIEYRWEERSTTPASSTGIRRQFEPTATVYLRFSIRLSKNWGWSGRPYHPHMMHFMTTENGKYHGPAASRLTLYIEPCNGRLRLAAQDIQNQDAPSGLTQGPLRGGYNGRFYDSPEVLFDDDAWHQVEVLFQLNSIDLQSGRPNRDGIVRGWFDGRLVIDERDVVLRSSDFPNMRFNQFLLTPYFGPGLLPHAQTLWIDDLTVASGRVTSEREATARKGDGKPAKTKRDAAVY